MVNIVCNIKGGPPMISSVSSVNFGNNAIDLASPGKYSQVSVPKTDAPADEFVGKKKSKAPAVIGGIAALAVAAAVTLGILSHKGKLPKVENAEKIMDKVKNVLADAGEWIAENGKGAYQWAKGLFGGKKAAEAVEEVAEAAEKAAEAAAK